MKIETVRAYSLSLTESELIQLRRVVRICNPTADMIDKDAVNAFRRKFIDATNRFGATDEPTEEAE